MASSTSDRSFNCGFHACDPNTGCRAVAGGGVGVRSGRGGDGGGGSGGSGGSGDDDGGGRPGICSLGRAGRPSV